MVPFSLFDQSTNRNEARNNQPVRSQKIDGLDEVGRLLAGMRRKTLILAPRDESMSQPNGRRWTAFSHATTSRTRSPKKDGPAGRRLELEWGGGRGAAGAGVGVGAASSLWDAKASPVPNNAAFCFCLLLDGWGKR